MKGRAAFLVKLFSSFSRPHTLCTPMPPPRFSCDFHTLIFSSSHSWFLRQVIRLHSLLAATIELRRLLHGTIGGPFEKFEPQAGKLCSFSIKNMTCFVTACFFINAFSSRAITFTLPNFSAKGHITQFDFFAVWCSKYPERPSK